MVPSFTARILSIASVVAVALVVGCNRKPSVPQAKPQAASAEPAASIEDSETPLADETPEQPKPKPEPPPPPAYVWPDDELRERIVLLAPGGPLVVDLWITVDGEPHAAAADELIDAAMAAAANNGDGRVMWNQWRENREFFATYAPGGMPNRRQLDMWQERYDQNGNHRIDRNEMADWLGRDAGRAVAPLSLRSSRTRGYGSNLDSRLWNLLDTDHSGGISADEMHAAADSLWALDANDDQVLVDAELTPLAEQLESTTSTTTRASRVQQRYAALHFADTLDRGRLGYLLADMYSPRGSLSSGSFAALPGLFGELDDGDGWLDDADLGRLETIEPHVRLAMSFEDSETPLARIEHVQISPRAEQLRATARPSDTRLVLELGDTRLVFTAQNLALAGEDAEQRLRRAQTQLMVHDQCDALFEFIDSNSDGRLGEREVSTVANRLAACDRDADGMLASDEVPYTLLAAVLHGENPSARNFFVPTSAVATVTASDAPKWFVAADLNGDGDLGRREFLGPADAFTALDANGDGFVDAEEAMAAE